MDQNDFRILVTVVSFIAFLAIVFWAFSRKSKPDFDVASRLPFETLDQAKQDEARESAPK
ncbi:MAG: cbb3-type cytochrome oxidase subunit 3 [Fluviibacter sp.]